MSDYPSVWCTLTPDLWLGMVHLDPRFVAQSLLEIAEYSGTPLLKHTPETLFVRTVCYVIPLK